MDDRPELLAVLLPVVKALRRIEDDAAATAGIGMWQYAILSVVEAEPGAHQRQVAARLQYSANRIVADIDDLEAKGLLTRRRGPDRRYNELHPTPAGRRTRAKVHAAIRVAEDGLLAGLSPARQRGFGRTAAVLAARLRSATRTG